MATAKQPGGFYRTAQGVAVDANGDAIKGAPKQTPDTEPSQQPGALGAQTPEERIGLAVARAVLDPKGTVAAATPPKPKADPKTDETEGEKDGEQEIPKIADLEDHLAGLKTAKEVKALQKRDERVGAQKFYEARLEELKGE